MRIGVVDLDTSHPQNWIPLEREMGCEIIGVWDGGSVHPPNYVRQFAQQWQIPRVYDTLEQMAQDVDCAIIHACDWDTHIAKAAPFVACHKAVLIDKPLAGKLRDLRHLCHWAKQGARITGGSSLRFCHEAQQFLAQPISQRGTPHTVVCGCGVDDFNYGIHAYALLCGIMGPGIQSVRHLGRRVQRRIQVNWADGRMGLLIVGATAKWLPFHTSITTECINYQFHSRIDRIYQSLLDACLPYLMGKTPQPPIPMEQLIEAELAALAAQKSWRHDDAEVPLSSLTNEDMGFDGAVFAAEYRLSKYPVKEQ